MKLFHLHVYKIAEMVEFDVEAPSAEVARQVALEHVKTNLMDWKEADCKHITMDFEIKPAKPEPTPRPTQGEPTNTGS